MATSFKALAELCEQFEATRKRLLITDLAAGFLRTLRPEEIEPSISMLLGRPFQKWSQRNLDVSWKIISDVIQRLTGSEWGVFAEAFRKTGDVGSATKVLYEKGRVRRQTSLVLKTLTLMEVRRSFEDIADAVGSGSREKKERLIEALFSLASPVEAKYLVRILIGGMRTGFYEGLMEQAVAKAFEVPLEMVQNASMAMGDLGEVAEKIRVEGKEGLSRINFEVFRPVNLMLAQMANDVSEAIREHGGKTAFEYKYDGARIQIHKLNEKVMIFSRRLADITVSLPEIVELAKNNVQAREAILEGEVVAVDSSGSPIPFQHLMRRFKRLHGIDDAADRVPIELYLFDILYVNGKSLISIPYVQRRKMLTQYIGKIRLASQTVAAGAEEAQKFLDEAISAGHEGLMAKRLDSSYTPGIRGKGWLKIKPVLEPLDLVIVSAEYGYGRRLNWLSDYYLAARDPTTGRFLPVGKTFKGLTDAELTEMTRRLKELAVREEMGKVVVVPKIVVEILYNEIQRSPKYECGMALRFARISRIRDDKTPEEADTIEKVKDIYERQFLKKGRYKN